MLIIKKSKTKKTLTKCPIGLFMWHGELCFKTEYSVNGCPTCYTVETGEAFWADVAGRDELKKIEVYPCKIVERTKENDKDSE